MVVAKKKCNSSLPNVQINARTTTSPSSMLFVDINGKRLHFYVCEFALEHILRFRDSVRMGNYLLTSTQHI